jgi:hypothetical protein
MQTREGNGGLQADAHANTVWSFPRETAPLRQYGPTKRGRSKTVAGDGVRGCSFRVDFRDPRVTMELFEDPSVMDPGTETSESAPALLTRRTLAATPGNDDASLSLHIVHHSNPFTGTRSNQVLSDEDMYARVNRIADVLLELGVDAGDSVGIFMPNCAQVRVCPWKPTHLRLCPRRFSCAHHKRTLQRERR